MDIVTVTPKFGFHYIRKFYSDALQHSGIDSIMWVNLYILYDRVNLTLCLFVILGEYLF